MGLTDEKIVNIILNANKKDEITLDEVEFTPVLEKISLAAVKKAINETIRFLYK